MFAPADTVVEASAEALGELIALPIEKIRAIIAENSDRLWTGMLPADRALLIQYVERMSSTGQRAETAHARASSADFRNRLERAIFALKSRMWLSRGAIGSTAVAFLLVGLATGSTFAPLPKPPLPIVKYLPAAKPVDELLRNPDLTDLRTLAEINTPAVRDFYALGSAQRLQINGIIQRWNEAPDLWKYKRSGPYPCIRRLRADELAEDIRKLETWPAEMCILAVKW